MSKSAYIMNLYRFGDQYILADDEPISFWLQQTLAFRPQYITN